MSGGRSKLRVIGFALALAVGLAALLAFLRHVERLSEREKLMVGVWFGHVTKADGSRYAWRTERRNDRTCRIEFRNYPRDRSMVPLEVGRWKIEGDRLLTQTWAPGEEVGLLEKLWSLVTTGHSPPIGWSEEYEILELTETSFICLHKGVQEYRSVRVPTDFELPEDFPGETPR